MRRLIVGISGATGAIYGVRILEVLAGIKDVETHLVLTRAAKMTIQVETTYSVKQVEKMANVVHDINNVGASISSGSFRTEGMVIAPCSMKTLAAVAHAHADDLVSRAADVVLKERRRLVLLPREAPLNLAHLRNMVAVTEMGGIVFPPVPAFYQRPKTIDDLVEHTVARVLDLFGVRSPKLRRWAGMKGTPPERG